MANEPLTTLEKALAPTKGTGQWLSPLNKLSLQRAITLRSAKVNLIVNGVRMPFIINYKRGTTKCFVKPAPSANQLTPCGWFDVNKVAETAWLAD